MGIFRIGKINLFAVFFTKNFNRRILINVFMAVISSVSSPETSITRLATQEDFDSF